MITLKTFCCPLTGAWKSPTIVRKRVMTGSLSALLHRWGSAEAPGCCCALPGDPADLCLLKSIWALSNWHPHLALWISQILPASYFGSLLLWGRDFFCLGTTLQQIVFNAMETLYLLFSEALLCFLRQAQMWGFISNNFCLSFPLYSPSFSCSILFILWTKILVFTVQAKNRGSTSRCIYALWSYLALVLGCSLLGACIYWYSLLHLKNSNRNTVNTQKCNYPISCHLHWGEKGKPNASGKKAELTEEMEMVFPSMMSLTLYVCLCIFQIQ